MSDKTNKITDTVISEFMQMFHFNRRADCLKATEAYFEKMIIEDWSKESLSDNKMLIVLYTRSNCQWRDQISNYDAFVDKAVKYLEDNNIEPQKILKGII